MASLKKRIQKFIKRNKFLLASGLLLLIICFNFMNIKEGANGNAALLDHVAKMQKWAEQKRKLMGAWAPPKNMKDIPAASKKLRTALAEQATMLKEAGVKPMDVDGVVKAYTQAYFHIHMKSKMSAAMRKILDGLKQQWDIKQKEADAYFKGKAASEKNSPGKKKGIDHCAICKKNREEEEARDRDKAAKLLEKWRQKKN